MSIDVHSTAFREGEMIGTQFTGDGEDVSPPLAWEDLPDGTKELALICDDPDAPTAQPWVHWVLYNIPTATSGLPKGVQPSHLPDGTREGVNDSNRTGYGSPCPPVGRHRYYFKLYALDTTLRGLNLPTKADLETAMAGHVLAEAVLMGHYQKGG